MLTVLYVKAFHVVFMVSWFAGLFFLGRMLIYIKKAQEEAQFEVEQMAISGARRVWYIITLPSLCLTIGLGLYLAYQIGAYREGWLHFKLMMVIMFVFYNFYLARLRKRSANQGQLPSQWKLRLINEVPFFFLVAIILTVYLKDLFSGLWALFVLVLVLAAVSMVSYLVMKSRKSASQ